ncbi:MAG: HutD family protein [Tistlia sp.]|uniref:HutD family protein n=1 Tax=Tistlia sp. TaxID=3057121 RepID=UPI0034A597CF
MSRDGATTARHLPALGRAARPWKNGGGESADVALAPEGAGLEDFDWRVSIARVDGDGPFSLFPGVERTLAVLSGEGLRLAVGEAPPVELTPGSAPHRFPADVATDCRLLGGAVTDLNVMARRGRVEARLKRLRLEAGVAETFETGPALLLWVAGRGTVEAAGLSVVPAPLDALRCDGPARWRLRADSPVLAFLAEFS